RPPRSRYHRPRSRHAGGRWYRDAALPRRAPLARGGGGAERVRHARARCRGPARQVDRAQHGAGSGKAGDGGRSARRDPGGGRGAGAMKGISRRALAAELALAVEEDRLELAYQPKISLDTGELAGVEALARWHHPRLGTIAPAEFIPAAEAHGAIDLFTDWLLRTAFHQWCAWRDQG